MRRFISFFVAAFAVNIISWLFIYYKIRPSSEIVPLHYNIFYGADLVGKGYFIYLIPAAGLFIILLNAVVYRFTLRIDRFAGKTLAIVSFAAQILIFVALAFLKSLILV